MSGTHERRLAKLEALCPQPDDLSLWTSDEIYFGLLLAGETLGAVDTASTASKLRARIVETARSQREQPKHIDYCAAIWAKRSDDPFVPSVFGHEWEDIDFPDVMRRRAAMRAHPVVRQLLEGVATL